MRWRVEDDSSRRVSSSRFHVSIATWQMRLLAYKQTTTRTGVGFSLNCCSTTWAPMRRSAKAPNGNGAGRICFHSPLMDMLRTPTSSSEVSELASASSATLLATGPSPYMSIGLRSPVSKSARSPCGIHKLSATSTTTKTVLLSYWCMAEILGCPWTASKRLLTASNNCWSFRPKVLERLTPAAAGGGDPNLRIKCSCHSAHGKSSLPKAMPEMGSSWSKSRTQNPSRIVAARRNCEGARHWPIAVGAEPLINMLVSLVLNFTPQRSTKPLLVATA
mmetsp:Transcript_19893/g.54991  ORF Transcript_19893/g.54991 Transcript_19893/m.54991 type:complete len:276 (+) Transcript_19893:329-1156(+)